MRAAMVGHRDEHRRQPPHIVRVRQCILMVLPHAVNDRRMAGIARRAVIELAAEVDDFHEACLLGWELRRTLARDQEKLTPVFCATSAESVCQEIMRRVSPMSASVGALECCLFSVTSLIQLGSIGPLLSLELDSFGDLQIGTCDPLPGCQTSPAR